MPAFFPVRATSTSIRARLTATFAASIALILALSGVFLARQTRRAAQNRASELLKAAVDVARVEVGEESHQNLSLQQLARAEVSELTSGGLGLSVLDVRGKLLWRSRENLPIWPPNLPNQSRWRFQKFSARNQTLIFAFDFAPVERELREREILILGLGLVIWVASTLGAWLLVGRTLSPIERLSWQAQNASIQSLQVRLSSPSRDAEIVGLVGTLNALLERLEKDSQARGRFYAAASHELRTPLQSLIGEVDVILDRPRENADYREALETMRGRSLHLTTLVQELLQLNQLEIASQAPPATRLNLADTVERVLASFGREIEEKRLKTARELPDLEWELAPAHYEMLVRNLVENAVKYAPPGGKIGVKLEKCASQARLEICNSASVDENEDLAAWLEPFFRPDSARTSGAGGNGLGLAICRALAQRNGWNLQLQAQNQSVCATCVFGDEQH